MFMPTKDRVAIYSYLFKEGAMTCQKDVRIPKHHILDIPNLHVAKALLSLKSKGHVREVFNWQWHYFFLTDSGIEYLRQFLHLPADIVPATLKKPAGRPGGAVREEAGPGRRFGGDKEKGAGEGVRPSFGGEGGYRRQGGFGRARTAEAPAS